MTSTTLIFRLCDEDDEVNLDLDPEPPERPWAQLRPDADRRAAPGDTGDWDWQDDSGAPTPAPAEPADEGFAFGERQADEHRVFARPVYAGTSVHEEPAERRVDGDRAASSSWPHHVWPARRALGGFSSHRLFALVAIALVALVVLAIVDATRQSGRGLTGQRSVAAAAASAPPRASLPASVASPRTGRRPAPRPPAHHSAARRRRARPTHRHAPRSSPAHPHRPTRVSARTAAGYSSAVPVVAAAPTVPAPAAITTAPAPVVDPPQRPQAPPTAAPPEFSFER